MAVQEDNEMIKKAYDECQETIHILVAEKDRLSITFNEERIRLENASKKEAHRLKKAVEDIKK